MTLALGTALAALMPCMEDRTRIVVVELAGIAPDLAGLLRANDLDVRAAGDEPEALRLVETFDAHCVIIDLDGRRSGGELARELRRRHGSDLVVIAVTGDDGFDAVLAPEVREFDHCLRKPLDVSELAVMLFRPLPPLPDPGDREHGR